MDKREFLQVLGAATAAGFGLGGATGARAAASPYDVPLAFARPDSVSLLHLTDCHAQLLPLYLREPVAEGRAEPPKPTKAPQRPANGSRRRAKAAPAPARANRFADGSPEAYAFSTQDFERAAQRFGPVGGFAHLATLVRRLRASRPGSLLLDGGDSWQGSATALWTRGQDMAEACRLLGVDLMTGHWEFTLGAARVQELAAVSGAGFLASNVRVDGDAGAPLPFVPHELRVVNGHGVAVIGQAWPFTGVAHPRYFTPQWRFGIEEQALQKTVQALRERGANVVVLLSHNGLPIDLKLASRVSGIDVILGGHTHDPLPQPVVVKKGPWQTIVASGGSHGKFIGMIDLQVRNRRVMDFRYTLLPVFSRLLPADPAMSELIGKLRAPHEAQLKEVLATSEGALWRRSAYGGSWDQLLLDALMATQDAPIALSPGFRWGASLLPGGAITREQLMDVTATTYSYATLDELSGAQIKSLLEDAADHVHNSDPYARHGEDMLRVGGLSYSLDPRASWGARVSDLRLGGRPLEADKRYKVAAWAPLSDAARSAGLKPVWDLVEPWLQSQKVLRPRVPNRPKLTGSSA